MASDQNGPESGNEHLLRYAVEIVINRVATTKNNDSTSGARLRLIGMFFLIYGLSDPTRHPPLSMRAIRTYLNLPHSTAYPLVIELEEMGLIEKYMAKVPGMRGRITCYRVAHFANERLIRALETGS